MYSAAETRLSKSKNKILEWYKDTDNNNLESRAYMTMHFTLKFNSNYKCQPYKSKRQQQAI